MTNNIKSLDMKQEQWFIESKTNLGKGVTFDFSYLPNNWFKKTQKQITRECLIINKPSLLTLYRYNYSLKRFFEFLLQYGIELETFEDFTYQYSQM